MFWPRNIRICAADYTMPNRFSEKRYMRFISYSNSSNTRFSSKHTTTAANPGRTSSVPSHLKPNLSITRIPLFSSLYPNFRVSLTFYDFHIDDPDDVMVYDGILGGAPMIQKP